MVKDSLIRPSYKAISLDSLDRLLTSAYPVPG